MSTSPMPDDMTDKPEKTIVRIQPQNTRTIIPNLALALANHNAKRSTNGRGAEAPDRTESSDDAN